MTPISKLYWDISKVSWGRTPWEPSSCHTKKKKKISVSYQACCFSNILLVVSFTSKIYINTMYSTFSALMSLPFHFTKRLLIKVLFGKVPRITRSAFSVPLMISIPQYLLPSSSDRPNPSSNRCPSVNIGPFLAFQVFFWLLLIIIRPKCRSQGETPLRD